MKDIYYRDYSVARALRDLSVVQELPRLGASRRYLSPSPFEYPESIVFKPLPTGTLVISFRYPGSDLPEHDARAIRGNNEHEIVLSEKTGRVLEIRLLHGIHQLSHGDTFPTLQSLDPSLFLDVPAPQRRTFYLNALVVDAVLRGLPADLLNELRDGLIGASTEAESSQSAFENTD